MMHYRYYSFLLVLQVVIMLSSLTLVHKQLCLFTTHCSLASFIFPFIFPLNNVIAEAYSYQESKMMLWLSLFAQIPYSLLCGLALFLPSPHGTAHAEMFHFVFNDMLRISSASIFATAIAININLWVFSKLKQSQYRLRFILRCFIASVIGEFIFTITALPMMFLNTVALNNLLHFIALSLFIKFCYCLILSPPSGLLANYLKHHENRHPINQKKYEYFSYNPYKVFQP